MRSRGDVSAPERPEEILDRRLARGEIDPAAYDELRAKLRTARAERV
ncbi:MAG: SHOCT domain-containing protein [Actinomycetota bacterium]